MDSEIMSCRFRTARQKKRLQKEDHDKQLIALGDKEDRLMCERNRLPLAPIKEPYQSGWKRTFILRDDVRLSEHAAFFETLLAKINNEQLSPDKDFFSRKRRKQRNSNSRTRSVREQHLEAFHEWSWNSNRFGLSEQERRYFERVEKTRGEDKTVHIRYVFREPWRFVLQVRPHIITHRKQKNEVLEQEIAAIDNRIQKRNLRPRMTKLEGGAYKDWQAPWRENPRQRSPVKNKPMHAILGECIEEQTNIPTWAL